MAQIETVYRCRIDYEWSDDCDDALDAIEQVERKAFKFAAVEGRNVVECESYPGCPACFPFISLESFDRDRLEQVAGKVERWIKRLKAVKLCLT